MWPLEFIAEDDFTEHVKKTIQKYGEKLEPYNLNKFNKNIVDPIKLIFDKTVYSSSWDEIIKNEIFRQRDKSNNNDIGYFHQNFFSYVSGCDVPDSGWDVIINKDDGILLPDGDIVHTIYVEMKNKHNTMNSASSSRTYMKMQNQLLINDDCACFLVEAIAKKSQNIKWAASVDGNKMQHKLIRRVSMDQFYSLVTGIDDAFYQMCMVLPNVIKNVVENHADSLLPNDTVMQELQQIVKSRKIDGEEMSIAMAVYILGFSSYLGFADNNIEIS
ncbi:Eco47II restriction endonuclease [compost metagenome]